MKANMHYVCIKCHKQYPFSKDIVTCSEHSQYYGYLTLVYEYSSISFNSESTLSWMKYREMLPIDSAKINFNEQRTPLIELNNLGRKYNIDKLYVKDESKNPTGSFKDKESFCALNRALEWGIENIFVASSGNAAVSTAAYAQKAGVQCSCLVSSDLSVGKRFLLSLYGGNIIERKGSYEDIYRWAIDSNFAGWNCTPGYNPIKEEGIKIIGYEIWEEIQVPDVIIAPCGNGTLLFGIFKAFHELRHMGLINKIPKFIGVQIKNSAPLKKSFEEKKDYVRVTNIPESIAEGIIAEESYSSPKVMYALSESGGSIVEVDDIELGIALHEVIQHESLIPEPTSAVVYAALKKLSFSRTDRVVLIQSAGGMKNLKEIMELFLKQKKSN